VVDCDLVRCCDEREKSLYQNNSVSEVILFIILKYFKYSASISPPPEGEREWRRKSRRWREGRTTPGLLLTQVQVGVKGVCGVVYANVYRGPRFTPLNRVVQDFVCGHQSVPHIWGEKGKEMPFTISSLFLYNCT
jgi:hypothetical protein